MKKLHNGYSIEKVEAYDGYVMTYLYGIFDKNHKRYCTCSSYKKAVEIVLKLA